MINMWTEINQNLYISTGAYASVNIVLVISGDEAAIIDTGFEKEEADRVKEFIVKNHYKFKYIFITHHHHDHINNLDMFTGPNVEVFDPTNTKDHQIIKMGDIQFRVIKTIGHANNQHISIEINNNILAAGDVLFTNLLPGLPFGGNHKDLLKTLEKLKKNNYSLIIPGHGIYVEDNKLIDITIQYLKNASDKVKDILEENQGYEAIENIKIEDCLELTDIYNYENFPMDLHLENLKIIYSELSK